MDSAFFLRGRLIDYAGRPDRLSGVFYFWIALASAVLPNVRSAMYASISSKRYRTRLPARQNLQPVPATRCRSSVRAETRKYLAASSWVKYGLSVISHSVMRSCCCWSENTAVAVKEIRSETRQCFAYYFSNCCFLGRSSTKSSLTEISSSRSRKYTSR